MLKSIHWGYLNFILGTLAIITIKITRTTSNAIWLKLNEWNQVYQNDDVEIKMRYNGTKTRFLTCIICQFGFLMLIWLGFCDAIPYNNCKEWYQYKVTQHRSEDYQMPCVAVLYNCFMSTRKKKLQKYDRNDLISNQNWYLITLDIWKRYLMIICNKSLIWGSIDIFSLKRSSF